MTRNRRLAALTCLICLVVSMPVAASPQASVHSWLDEFVSFVLELFGAPESGEEDEDVPALWPAIEPVGENAASTVDLLPDVESEVAASDESEDTPTANLFPEVEPVG